MYTVKVEEKIDKGDGFWNHLKVGIYKGEERIGEYMRNYPDLFDTFCPFTIDDKDYALYSPDYIFTRIIRLPECIDIGGEEYSAMGFCPTDYYVTITDNGRILGFVKGCIWGDDSSMKLEYLDLSRADEGIIKREAKFGYFELPDGARIEDCVDVEEDDDPEDPELIFYIKGQTKFYWDGEEFNNLRKVR